MAERSKRIEMYDAEKIKNAHPETLKLYNKYKMDMELRELSPTTIAAYESDLGQWFSYIYDNQGNQPITELTEDDLTEFFYYCKKEGNNSRRIKRRMSSISALYIYLMKKRLLSLIMSTVLIGSTLAGCGQAASAPAAAPYPH